MDECVTHYVDDVSQWEKWQQKYRFGVLLIYPPDPPFSQVNALREKYDAKSSETCDAHISLTIPLPRPLSMSHWNELELIALGFKSFIVHYGPLKDTPYRGITLAIEPQVELDRLRIALEKASVFNGAEKRPYPFSAHMTIAEFITMEQTKELTILLREVVPNGNFVCSGVSYAVPDENFHFAERARLIFNNSTMVNTF